MGFLGLEDRYTATWNGGRTVTVYPDGTVIDNTTGEFVRLPEEYLEELRQKNTSVIVNNVMPNNDNGIKDLIVLALIIALILYLVSKK